jgi:hypothetical protein
VSFVLRIALSLALLGVFAGSAHAAASLRHETAASANVSATVGYRKVSSTRYAMQLKIALSGKTAYDKPVPTSFAQTGSSRPLGYTGGADTVEVGDLDGDGIPEVLVNLYTGGAHCCNWTWVYHYVAKKKVWSRTAHIWGDPRYTLADLSHTDSLELVSADDRFAYAFSDYADSALPVQVWTFGGGRFTDTTRKYTKLIQANLNANWRSATRAPKGTAVRGILAAWVADNCLVNNCSFAYKRVQALAPQLNGAGDSANGSVASYLRKLKSSLVAWGYWK